MKVKFVNKRSHTIGIIQSQFLSTKRTGLTQITTVERSVCYLGLSDKSMKMFNLRNFSQHTQRKQIIRDKISTNKM